MLLLMTLPSHSAAAAALCRPGPESSFVAVSAKILLDRRGERAGLAQAPDDGTNLRDAAAKADLGCR